MSISGVASCSQTAFESVLNPQPDDFSSLGASIKSGDLSAAQKMFDKIKENAGISEANEQTASSFERLERALQAGNVVSAQQAFAALKADVQGVQGAAATDAPAPETDPRNGVGTIVDVRA